MEENIPVVLVDTLIGTDDYVNAYMTDNVAAGALAAEEMARLMNYEGTVHLFAGTPASTSNVARLKGFEEYMAANCPKIKVLGTLYSEADINLCTTQTVDVLSANPDLKAIFRVGALIVEKEQMLDLVSIPCMISPRTRAMIMRAIPA